MLRHGARERNAGAAPMETRATDAGTLARFEGSQSNDGAPARSLRRWEDMTTIRVRFQSNDRCMLIGAESLDPYLAQTLADDFRRNTRDSTLLDVDVPRGEAPEALAMLVHALQQRGLQVRMPEEHRQAG
jgi:hypothetical protein